MKRLLFLAMLMVFATGFAFSIDYGLLLEDNMEAGNGFFYNNIGFTPWFSWNNGEGLSLYLSGFFSVRYNSALENEERWAFIPEVSRFALNYRFNRGTALEAGRIPYTDALGFTASGLFDGVRFETVQPFGKISAGAFYTGLLYRETAKIVMTAGDAVNFNKGGYWASRRIILTGRYDMPYLESLEALNLSAELIAQFDVNNNDENLHSQYLMVHAEYYPASMMRLRGGAALTAMQNSSGDFGTAFGLLAQFKTALDFTPLNDWANFTVKFTSASTNNAFTAFTTITSIPQGYVFPGNLAGLALIGADYSAMIIDNVYAEGGARFFMQTYDPIGAGAELWASAAWQPFEDLRTALGAGMFFPMGKDNPFGDEIKWKINAGFVMAF